MLKLLFLCFMIFLAGFIDSIAGGGGLISLTSYVACGIPMKVALGTNKFSAFVGCTIADVNYIRTKNYDFVSLVPSVITSIIGSKIGSQCSLIINEKVFSIFMLVITPIIAAFVIFDKHYENHEKNYSGVKRALISAVLCLVIGFYDGLYGPGTGTFLTMGYIFLAGISVKKSCGNAHIANWASNLGSLLTYIPTGNIMYNVAIPCALCSIVGNYLGSSLAIKKDIKVVKPIMIVVILLLLVKLLFSLF